MLRLKLMIALAIAVAAWPAGAYGRTDPPSGQDLRSPDARDAALAPDTSPPQDLRSPDARDAAHEHAFGGAESRSAPPSGSPQSAATASSGATPASALRPFSR